MNRSTRQTTHVGGSAMWGGSSREVTERRACWVMVNRSVMTTSALPMHGGGPALTGRRKGQRKARTYRGPRPLSP